MRTHCIYIYIDMISWYHKIIYHHCISVYKWYLDGKDIWSLYYSSELNISLFIGTKLCPFATSRASCVVLCGVVASEVLCKSWNEADGGCGDQPDDVVSQVDFLFVQLPYAQCAGHVGEGPGEKLCCASLQQRALVLVILVLNESWVLSKSVKAN